MSALDRIFIRNDDELVKEVPDYWRPFLQGRVRKDKNRNLELPSSEGPATDNVSPFMATKLAEGTTIGKLKHMVRPHYPEVGRKLRLAGDVIFDAVIGKDGKIEHFAVLKPLGAGFEEEALRALRQWVYTPYAVSGQPVVVRTTLTVHFEMR